MRTLAMCSCTLALSLSIVGCSKKTPECNQLVEVVNTVGGGAEPVDSAGGAAKAHAGELSRVADSEERAASDLGKLNLTLPELQKFSTDFQSTFKAHASASRDIAGMLDKLPDAKALESRIAKAREQMETSQNALETACREKTAACEPFAKQLAEHPDAEAVDATDAGKTKAWAASVDAWAEKLAKTEVTDAEIKPELARLEEGMKNLAAVMVELSSITADAPKRDVAQKAAETSAKAMGTLVEDLNKFCQSP